MQIRQFILIVCATVMTSVAVNAQVPFYGEYKSPSKKLTVKLLQEDSRSYFMVYFNGKMVLDHSLLGIETSTGSFSYDLNLKSSVSSKVKSLKYTLNSGKKALVSKRYREVIYPLVNLQGKEIDLIFRIFDDGVAYRYGLKGRGQCVVMKEQGNFAFPANTSCYMTPLATPKSGWAKTNPSNEEHYIYGERVGKSSNFGAGWSFPALYNVPDAGWVLISETGVDGNYAGSHLADNSENGVYKLEFPGIEEGLLSQNVYPTFNLPFQTPWRMLVINNNPLRVAESTLSTDLVEPLYKAKAEYKPGKASWSWLVLKDDSVTYDVTKSFIDMAAHLDFAYCLVDAPWDVNIGRDKIAELAAYGKTRNVGLILWYNSNGNWNDAPQTPKGFMNDPDIRKKEMKWMQQTGIKGIKVDFFGGDKQFYMQYYQDILKDANDYGLSVNFHGTTIPRGWERMFPNFITCESVKGMEYCTFGQADADMQPKHCATLPFTRNVVGPMDFTPVVLNARLGANRISGPERRTTAAFELALPVVLQSGIQHLGIIPENIKQQDFVVADYLRAVPATWDDTRFISGMPGEDCVVARRKAGVWYVAGINGESKTKVFKLNLADIIKPGIAGLAILDSDNNTNLVRKTDVVAPSKKSPLEISVPAYGGFVIKFVTAKK